MSNRPPRFVCDPECLTMIGHGRSKRDDLVRKGEFPKPIKLGRKKVWLESEIHTWIIELAKRHGKVAA